MQGFASKHIKSIRYTQTNFSFKTFIFGVEVSFQKLSRKHNFSTLFPNNWKSYLLTHKYCLSGRNGNSLEIIFVLEDFCVKCIFPFAHFGKVANKIFLYKKKPFFHKKSYTCMSHSFLKVRHIQIQLLNEPRRGQRFCKSVKKIILLRYKLFIV